MVIIGYKLCNLRSTILVHVRPTVRIRGTFHVPNLMKLSSNKGFCSFTLDSAHEKFDV